MAVDSRSVNSAPSAPAPSAAVPPAELRRSPRALAIPTLALTTLALATLAFSLSCSPPGDHPTREGRAVQTADHATRTTPDAAPSRPDETAASPSIRTALITRVIDGDTVVLESGERVRYIGIDTPELRGAPEVVALGRAAAEHNRQLVEGKTARLVPDTRRRDRHGRLLAYVYIDTLFVNARMIADGYALAYTVPPDVKHAEWFRALEREARERRRGLWGESPGLDDVHHRP